MEKRTKQVIFGISIFVFILFMGFVSYGKICSNSSFTITDKILKITPGFLDSSVENLLSKSIGGQEIGGWIDDKAAAGTNLLGYGRDGKQSICLFFYDLGVGLFIGFWIWAIYLLYNAEFTLSKNKKNYSKFTGEFTENLYLKSIGGGAWKIPIIAFAYAVIMQIPFLNAAVDVICFDFLANGFWFDVIVRSMLVAFYIAGMPTAYTEWKRYRLIKSYEYAVLRKKYQAQAQGAAFKA